MRRSGWIGALLLTAFGLYFSSGLLDVVGGAPGIVRVAMLPPLWELAALAVVLGGVGFAGARTDRDPDVLLPLCAAALFVAPYLPWLPDRLPVLQALAGPVVGPFWGVLGYLVVSTAVSGRQWQIRRAQARAAIFIASLLVFGLTAWRLTSTVQFPSGDEPHYLVITQSLLKDGDLKIENNHQREDYKAYFSLPLKPDYLTRGTDGQIYSIHPVGLPILALPAFALGGYKGVVAMLVTMAAIASVLLWTLAYEISESAAAATFAWAAAALTAPFLFNSFTVYPEIPGALALLLALGWRPSAASAGGLIAKGVALGALPWLSTKYAPMAAAATLVLMLRARLNIRVLIPLLIPIGVLGVSWLFFFHWLWGTFSPSAPYGASDPMTFNYLAHGGPGLFFDQEYGVVAYAPVLALSIVGFAAMLRSGGPKARLAVELMGVLGALVVTVGAFHIWWGGSASPGRPVASAILLLGVPIACLFAAAPAKSPTRAIYQLLLASSLAIAFTLAVTQDGALLHNDRDGTATLLEWMLPIWPLSSVFPSFIAQPLTGAIARTAGWLTLGAVVFTLARLAAPRRAGSAAAAALVLGSFGASVFASATWPASASLVAPDARARLPLLDEFDARRRPLTILYDPWSRITPTAALSHAALVARPGLRTARQPIDLLWNARFALPAGEYRIDLRRPQTSGDASIGLQIGRVGPPVERWTIEGAAWQRSITLPIDMALVGLRPSTPHGFEDGELQITPVRVVDESSRLARPPVLSATPYGALTAYFHDDTTAGEAAGFWTRGRATTRVTYAAPVNGPATIDLDVRCGPIANRVTLAAPGWTENLVVEPGGSKHVSVPTVARQELGLRLAPLDVQVRDGFVPAELDRRSTDRRVLGCWIDMSGSAR